MGNPSASSDEVPPPSKKFLMDMSILQLPSGDTQRSKIPRHLVSTTRVASPAPRAKFSLSLPGLTTKRISWYENPSPILEAPVELSYRTFRPGLADWRCCHLPFRRLCFSHAPTPAACVTNTCISPPSLQGLPAQNVAGHVPDRQNR